MPEFLVRWEIEVTADDPLSAAIDAANVVKDPESIATIFDIFDQSGNLIETIDVVKAAGGR